MAKARWAKWNAEAHLRPEPEPKLTRYFPLEIGIRDKRTKEVAWTDFRSVRDATKRLAVIQKNYVAGVRSGICSGR